MRSIAETTDEKPRPAIMRYGKTKKDASETLCARALRAMAAFALVTPRRRELKSDHIHSRLLRRPERAQFVELNWLQHFEIN